jgi:metal-dependent amidase/aminoacylase/carboxypeptidase family protein
MLPAASALLPIDEQVVEDRRYLHAHPELAFEEHETARFVAERLRALGIEVHTGIAKTGVLGVLHTGRAGKTVLLRADMDALPIHELNDVPYRSQTDGVMHACGHDAHTAILLSVARAPHDRSGRAVSRLMETRSACPLYNYLVILSPCGRSRAPTSSRPGSAL